MPLISRSIPTLLRGVSQASDSTKQADHADIQDNANSDPVVGLTKRSGTQFMANLITSGTPIGNAHVKFINKNVNERYIAIFTSNNVRVFELDGTELTVHKPDGVGYLNTTTPRDELKTVTIADFTFVVNTTKTTAMDSTLTSGPIYNDGSSNINITNQAIVFIKQVTANTDYTLIVDGRTCVFNSGTTNLKTSHVANKLKGGLTGDESDVTESGTALTASTSGNTFNITSNGSVVRIFKNNNSDFNIQLNDSQGNTQTTLVKNSIQRFTDLPTVAPNGYVVEVKGDRSSDFDNYYVKFTTNNTTADGTLEEGQWEETAKLGINKRFDYDTMPHVLIRQADGNFRFARVDGDSYTASGQTFTLPKWGERTVGDLTSAPNPSFIGSTINNVLFFRNRLGFLSSDNVILSRVSEFFNFFAETVLSVIDSDPIDVAASHTKVAILKNAINMGEKLILFSDQTQFTLASSSDSLTPATANVIVSTEFESSDSATPVGSGASIYYLTEKGNFSSVREYIFQPGIDIKDASNITIHVPRLIPNDVFKIAVSTNQDILALVSLTNPNILYINRWLYGSRSEKILNSWFTYTFNAKKAIKDVEFLGTDLLITCDDVGESVARVTLEKLSFATDFREPNALFEYHLDHKVSDTTTGVSVSYDADTDTSTFTVPYKLNGTMKVIGRYLATGETSTFVDTTNTTQTLKPGQIIQTTNLTNNTTSTIEADGDYRNSKFIIGESYEMHYRFSTQRLTESAGGQRTGEIISGRLQLKHFYLKFEDSGFFKVEVTPENNVTSTHKFTGRFLGATSGSIGDITLETGTLRVPILSRADRVNIDIKNDTFLPTILSSAEYEAMFHMRSTRM